MKIGDKVVIVYKFAGCFNKATGTIIEECIPNSQFRMLTGAQRWVVQFDEPVDTGFGFVISWDFPEHCLMLN